MSANYRAASVGWRALPRAARRGCGVTSARFRPAAAALLGIRQLLEALDGAWRKRCAGNGGPLPPEDQPMSGSIWDDPALWMAMMH